MGVSREYIGISCEVGHIGGYVGNAGGIRARARPVTLFLSTLPIGRNRLQSESNMPDLRCPDPHVDTPAAAP